MLCKKKIVALPFKNNKDKKSNYTVWFWVRYLPKWILWCNYLRINWQISTKKCAIITTNNTVSISKKLIV